MYQCSLMKDVLEVFSGAAMLENYLTNFWQKLHMFKTYRNWVFVFGVFVVGGFISCNESITLFAMCNSPCFTIVRDMWWDFAWISICLIGVSDQLFAEALVLRWCDWDVSRRCSKRCSFHPSWQRRSSIWMSIAWHQLPVGMSLLRYVGGTKSE